MTGPEKDAYARATEAAWQAFSLGGGVLWRQRLVAALAAYEAALWAPIATIPPDLAALGYIPSTRFSTGAVVPVPPGRPGGAIVWRPLPAIPHTGETQ